MAHERRTSNATASRRRRTSSPTRRRRKTQPIRFDLIFLAVIALVTLVLILLPRQQVDTPPTQDTTAATERQINLTFSSADADLVHVRTTCDGQADVNTAILEPLDWDLTDPGFTVLIIHSHISESYTLTEDQIPNESSSFTSDPYRTDDDRYNMIAIGQRLAATLRSRGIRVIHDTSSFEQPNSDYAYANAREHLEGLLAQNPDIGLILDLHRDAVQNSDGTQWAPTVTVKGRASAKLSMLIGYSGVYDSHWNQNLSFACKLGARLNQNTENAFRQLLIRSSTTCYNQDLGPVTMLIEVGTAGNSLEEALNATDLLGDALADLAAGANLETE